VIAEADLTDLANEDVIAEVRATIDLARAIAFLARTYALIVGDSHAAVLLERLAGRHRERAGRNVGTTTTQ
jgi:hypothetical protein